MLFVKGDKKAKDRLGLLTTIRTKKYMKRLMWRGISVIDSSTNRRVAATKTQETDMNTVQDASTEMAEARDRTTKTTRVRGDEVFDSNGLDEHDGEEKLDETIEMTQKDSKEKAATSGIRQ